MSSRDSGEKEEKPATTRFTFLGSIFVVALSLALAFVLSLALTMRSEVVGLCWCDIWLVVGYVRNLVSPRRAHRESVKCYGFLFPSFFGISPICIRRSWSKRCAICSANLHLWKILSTSPMSLRLESIVWVMFGCFWQYLHWNYVTDSKRAILSVAAGISIASSFPIRWRWRRRWCGCETMAR